MWGVGVCAQYKKRHAWEKYFSRRVPIKRRPYWQCRFLLPEFLFPGIRCTQRPSLSAAHPGAHQDVVQGRYPGLHGGTGLAELIQHCAQFVMEYRRAPVPWHSTTSCTGEA